MPARATFRISLAILLIAAGSIASAWIFEAAGYAPCELCLKERLPYYVGVPLAGVAVYCAATSRNAALAAAFAGLSFIFAASAGFGAYHAGVEWGFWPGPTDCTGPLDHAASVKDFLAELQRVKVIRCDAAAIRIVGLSLAGWNAVISTGLALLAFVGASEARR
ncbi:disulfide bond formation protein B [Methylocapsa acidiphila]|uniref:disulfide bond formation protein B n=1 Tax=Methylocapsa acidiphila TaxID=133552 RepID=UPI00041A9E51|nr:disulfide bond formation protein B [Methylocapsa acidiphila]